MPVQCLLSKGIPQLKSKEMQNSMSCLAQRSTAVLCFSNQFLWLLYPILVEFLSLCWTRESLKYPVFVFSTEKCLYCINQSLVSLLFYKVNVLTIFPILHVVKVLGLFFVFSPGLFFFFFIKTRHEHAVY